MRECDSDNPMLEKEEDLVAAAQQIVRAVEKNRKFTKETIEILANLGAKLLSLTASEENKDEEGISEIKTRLNAIQTKVMNWVEDESMIFDRGSEEAYEYLKICDEARILAEQLENTHLNKDNCSNELLSKAHDIIQTSMVRLEDEFKHLLVENRQPFEPEHMSFRSTEDDILDDRFVISTGEDSSFEESLHRERDSFSRRSSEDFLIQLVHPSVIPDLKSIANLMFDSDYDRECTQAFIGLRKEALDECLYILEVEKLSIEDVTKMEWGSLNSKIKRWIKTMKIFVRVYLASEKSLSDQIFGDLDSVSSTCFTEASKSSILQLLTFAEAIAIGPHTPEKLFKILDMYEVLANLIPDIEALYMDEAGSYVRDECLDVLKSLGFCAKSTFLEFEKLVASNVSSTPFAGGGIHHITRYVMNYIKNLNDYMENLNVLLKDYDQENNCSFSPDLYPSSGEQSLSRSSSHAISLTPTAIHLKSLISTLERNLDDKAKLYKDDSLGHIFLMNNTHYITEKVKSSELRTILGDEWIRKHNWKFQQHAMNYERSTWSSILSLLRDDGLYNPGSSSVSKTLLKERLHHFYLAFEEVYKNQTSWLIPDSQLRDDLRISTSLKVIQAYRTFVGRHVNHLSEKNIKYSADELEDYLLDLFEGSPKSLHSFHRK